MSSFNPKSLRGNHTFLSLFKNLLRFLSRSLWSLTWFKAGHKTCRTRNTRKWTRHPSKWDPLPSLFFSLSFIIINWLRVTPDSCERCSLNRALDYLWQEKDWKDMRYSCKVRNVLRHILHSFFLFCSFRPFLFSFHSNFERVLKKNKEQVWRWDGFRCTFYL